MTEFNLTPANPLIKKYHATLTDITGQGAHNEGAVRRAFETLLIDYRQKARLDPVGGTNHRAQKRANPRRWRLK